MWWFHRVRPGLLGAAILFWAPMGAAAQTACGDLSQSCGDVIAPACLEKFGAGSLPAETETSAGVSTDASADASCGAQFEAYRSCLSEVAAQCDGSGDVSGAARGAGLEGGEAPAAHRLVAETSVTGGAVFVLRHASANQLG